MNINNSLYAKVCVEMGENHILLPDSPSLIFEKGDDLVVSITSDGTKSRYGDDTWNLSPYEKVPNPTSIFKFKNWSSNIDNLDEELSKAIVEELKIIQFFRLNYYKKKRLPSSVYNVGTDALAKIAYINNTSISNILNNPKYHSYIESSFSEACQSKQESLSSLIDEIVWLTGSANNNKITSFLDIDLDKIIGLKKNINKLYRLFKKNQRDTDLVQTPIIPSRLYLAFLNSLDEHIDRFYYNLDNIERFLEERFSIGSEIRNYGRKNIGPCGLSSINENYTWANILKRFSLEVFFEDHELKSLSSFDYLISKIQKQCMLMIISYTGMRLGESRILPSDCFITKKINNREVSLIKGYTYKTTGTSQITRGEWITIGDIEKPFSILTMIGRTYGIRNGYNVTLCGSEAYPLICSIKNIKIDWYFEGGAAPLNYKIGFSNNKEAFTNWFYDAELIVTQEDMDELNNFYSLREWEEDDGIRVGEPWPLTAHQLRRSLAVYAARSGIVSVPSLKKQLKHLTYEMTLYYQRRSARAKNIIDSNTDAWDDVKSLIKEYQHQADIAELINYENKVIKTKEVLTGGEGVRLQRLKDKNSTDGMFDKNYRESKFINHEARFQSQGLGYCTRMEPCDKMTLTFISPCVGTDGPCSFLVADDSIIPKLERIIENLKRKAKLKEYQENTWYKSQLESEIGGLEKTLENERRVRGLS